MSPNSPTLGFLLHDVARLLKKRFEQIAKGSGLTRSQWQVLAHLSVHEGIHQGGLAEILEIEPITLVRILDKLEASALIERRRHERDRRIWLLYLTDKAHPLLGEMRALSEMTRAEALAGLSPDDRSRLIGVLSVMKSNLIEVCSRPIDEQEIERKADKEARHETSHG